MSIHARPLAGTTNPHDLAGGRVRVAGVATAAPPVEPAAEPIVRPSPAPAAPPPDPAGRSQHALAAAQPWYRRERWLAFLAAAFVPMFLALVAPARFRAPLVGVSALLAIAALAVIARRGVPRADAS